MAKAAPQHSITTTAARHHKPKLPEKPEKRGHARARGYSRRWEKFRRTFLSANPLCEFCKGAGRITPATVVDHDLPHEHDPALFWDNSFTALCSSCHSGTKQRLEARLRGQALLAEVRRLKRAQV